MSIALRSAAGALVGYLDMGTQCPRARRSTCWCPTTRESSDVDASQSWVSVREVLKLPRLRQHPSESLAVVEKPGSLCTLPLIPRAAVLPRPTQHIQVPPRGC